MMKRSELHIQSAFVTFLAIFLLNFNVIASGSNVNSSGANTAGAGSNTEASGTQVIPSSENARAVFNLNRSWLFHKGGFEFGYNDKFNDAAWEKIELPHTWNASDPFDDDDGYYRGTGWYRKRIIIPEQYSDRQCWLRFEGANQVADVYVNGMFAGRHKGGYTAFSVDITPFIETGDTPNLIAVSVSNAHDPYIPPLSVGYALYGGIYRDLDLVFTMPVHFSLSDHGSCGIRQSTTVVNGDLTVLHARARVTNHTEKNVKTQLQVALKDPSGRLVNRKDTLLLLPGGADGMNASLSMEVPDPVLWSPDNPFLYDVEYTLLVDGKIADYQQVPLGIRSIALDPQKGFFLNGEKLFLRGTNRHQDFQGKGSALTNEDHVRDLKIIKEMGCNFVRLAHYPQDPAVLHACDSLGLLVWEEIPLVNYITTDPAFYENTKEMLREMIRQHYNHPSVITWGSMNEIFLWGKNARRMRTQEDPVYAGQVRQLALLLDSTIRAEDATRFTAMAVHGSSDYARYGLTGISDILGLNVYSGWYSGELKHFSGTIRKAHERYPDQAIIVSEYGAGSDSEVNSNTPERFDFSVQYQQLYHESYLGQMKEMDKLTGAAIWNQFDFSQPWTGGTIPHVNQKGMYTWDRRPKDVYYLYKANYSKEPFVRIASREWNVRAERAGKKGNLEMQPVKVYTNAGRVKLWVNGKSYGTKGPDITGTITWNAVLHPGENQVIAQAIKSKKNIADTMQISAIVLPSQLVLINPQEVDLAINCGSNVQYYAGGNTVWLADQPYVPGGFGYVGGEKMMLQKDIALKGTGDPALFFQYLFNPESYHFDLPDGKYLVHVTFAEPDLPGEQRVFEITCNDQSKVRCEVSSRDPLSTSAQQAVLNVTASGGKGIDIRFGAISGEPVISAIRVTANSNESL
ncbi:MAG: glycoside hydrolase family 2 TIM barrel-domain containing protein [Bacteroidales bacterium]|nr:glycoside hydrolase family 2 TIM barrel-domain containing protein [Bacteroidales bacterium]MDT8431933.1 glycoside hydrolase family 2 TIM barrel-domain containing protein [Bacteroidales bacterium]